MCFGEIICVVSNESQGGELLAFTAVLGLMMGERVLFPSASGIFAEISSFFDFLQRTLAEI